MVEVGFARTGPAAPLSGYVMAFGGWTRRCFAFVYTTGDSGPDAERLISDRLAVIDARALGGVELLSDLTPATGAAAGPDEPP